MSAVRSFVILAGALLCLQLSAREREGGGREPRRIENDSVLLWQPGVRLGFGDFRNDVYMADLMYASEYSDGNMMAALSILLIMDVPADARRGGKGKPVWSVVPVLYKDRSILLKEDDHSLDVQRLLFDLAECAARHARRCAANIEDDQTDAECGLDELYRSIYIEVCHDYAEFWLSEYENAYKVFRNPSRYAALRQRVDEMLEDDEDYATTPAEWRRFLKGRPLSGRYVEYVYTPAGE